MAKKLETGIYDGISNGDYHKLSGYVSNSYLSKLNKCPANALVKDGDTDTFAFGRAVHCYILEGQETFLKEFAIAPELNKRTKEGKAQFEEFQRANAEKTVITAEDLALVVSLHEAVYQHSSANMVLAEGKSEQTVIWTDERTGLLCKCRPDRIPSNGSGVLIDLKTTSDAGEYGFTNSVKSFGYARQAAMYLDGINAATGSDFDSFVFVAVEKKAPFMVAVYELDEEFIAWGRMGYQALMDIELECRAAGHYPNYQNDGIVKLYKPKYL